MPLFLQVNGTLEERLESLVSGLCWAEELGTTLEVYWWFFHPHIQCSFERLFSCEALPSWFTIHNGILESCVSIQSENQFIEKEFPSLIKSKCRFYEKNSEKWLFYLRLMRPSYEIKKSMNLILARGSTGIYIQNVREPPVARILAEVWRNHRSISTFLLSTDCYESKRFLQLMFKDKLFELTRISSPTHEKYYLENVLDFFCFSQCSTILNCSSCGLMNLASQYGNVHLINL